MAPATKKFIDLRDTHVQLPSKNDAKPQSTVNQDAYNYMPSLSASVPSSDSRFRFSTENNINTVKQHAHALPNSQYTAQNQQSSSSAVSSKSSVQPQQNDVINLMAQVKGLKELHTRQQQGLYKANPSPTKRGRVRQTSTSSSASSIHDVQNMQQAKVKQSQRYVHQQVQPPMEHDVNQYLSHVPAISPAARDGHLHSKQLMSIKTEKESGSISQRVYSGNQQLNVTSSKANLPLNQGAPGLTTVNQQVFIDPTPSMNGRVQNAPTHIQSSKHLRTVKHPHSPGIRYNMTSLKNSLGKDLKGESSKNSISNHSKNSQITSLLQKHFQAGGQLTPEIISILNQIDKPESQLQQLNISNIQPNKAANNIVNSNCNDKTPNVFTDQNVSQIQKPQKITTTNEISPLNSFSHSNKMTSVVKKSEMLAVKTYPPFLNNSGSTSIRSENKQSLQVNSFMQQSNFSQHNHVQMSQLINSPVVQVTKSINQNKSNYSYQNAVLKPNFIQEKPFLNTNSTVLPLQNKTSFNDSSEGLSHFVNNSKGRLGYSKVEQSVSKRNDMKFSLSSVSEKSATNFTVGSLPTDTDYMEFSTTQRNIPNQNDFSNLQSKSRSFSTISDDHLNEILSGSDPIALQKTSELNSCLNKSINKSSSKSIFEYKNTENTQMNYLDSTKKIIHDPFNSGLDTKLNISKSCANTFPILPNNEFNVPKNTNENRGYVNSNSRQFYNVNEIKSPFCGTNSNSASNNTSLEWSKYIQSSNSNVIQENLQKNTRLQQQSTQQSINCTSLSSLPNNFNKMPNRNLSTSTSGVLNKPPNFKNNIPNETIPLNNCSIPGFIQPPNQPLSQTTPSPNYANPKKKRLKMYMMEGQTATSLQQQPPRPLMALPSQPNLDNSLVQSSLQHQQQITPVDDGISKYFDDLLCNAHQQISTKNQDRLVSDPAITSQKSTRPVFDKSFLQEEPESLPPLTIETVECSEKSVKEGVVKPVVEKNDLNTATNLPGKDMLSNVDKPVTKEVKRLSMDLNSSVDNVDKTLNLKQNEIEKNASISPTLPTKRKGLKFKFTKFQSRAGDEIYQIKKKDRSFCSSEDEPAAKRRKIKKRKKLKKKSKKYKETISAETGEEEINDLIKQEAPIRLKINIGKTKNSIEKVTDYKEDVSNSKMKAKKLTAETVDESSSSIEHRNIFAVMNEDFETKNSRSSSKSSVEKPLKVKLCIPKEKKPKKINSGLKKTKLKTTVTEVKESPVLKSPIINKTATYKFGFGKSKVVLKRSRQLQKSGSSASANSQANSSYAPIVTEKEVQNTVGKISLRTPPRTNFDQVNDEYAFPMDTPSKAKKPKADQKSKSPTKAPGTSAKANVKSMVAELINPPSSALKNGSRKSRYQVKLKIKTISS